jgi:hypothetical protein
MIETEFDKNLRTAYRTPETPSTLDSKIDRALAQHTHVRQVRRRVVLSFAATATAALAFVTLPAVKAQASLSGIVRALNGVERLEVSAYTIDENGNQVPYGKTEFDHGAWHETGGNHDSYELYGRRYQFDSDLKAFITEGSRNRMTSLKLSDLLGPAGIFSLGKRVQAGMVMDGGQERLKATVKNGDLPERYVIYADKTTELPVRIEVEGLERNQWRVTLRSVFDYSPKAGSATPDLKKFPVIDRSEADRRIENALTKTEVAQIPAGAGRLVVRKFDVADDGTVFVLYQSGLRVAERQGTPLEISDNLGTRYVRVGEGFADPIMMQRPGEKIHPLKPLSKLADGRFEGEVFMPLNPIPASTPRTIRLGARQFGDGSLARLTANFWFVGEETNQFWQWSGTISGRPIAPGSAKPVTVLQAPNVRATCGAAPAWTLHVSHGSFYSEEDSRMQKARRRATIAMQQNRWTEAEEQLNEVQKAMRDSERKGYGPYSRDAVLQDLDKVQAALGR